MMGEALRIGTRGSQLALWQARWVQQSILEQWPGTTVELVIVKTQGDKILDVPLAQVGGKGLFVKEIEEALLDGRIDLAVHSMKDMPAALPEGLHIAAVPLRENPLDALISLRHASLADLPQGARVGTSSLRRGAQLLHQRPDLTIDPLRGNVDTRLKKLETTELDAIVLAAAGLTRLGLADRITAHIAPDIMLPAVGQGALCIEARNNDGATKQLLAALDHRPTHVAITAERAFLHRLEGGCQIPLAGHATLENDQLQLTGLVAELDGSRMVRATNRGAPDQAAALGRQLAETLLHRGAGEILERLQAHAR
nr:hydroxymethylbilane synthase [Desulfatitalea alkaliphila]